VTADTGGRLQAPERSVPSTLRIRAQSGRRESRIPGSDVPIGNLRSGFGPLYAVYDETFAGFSGDERAMLSHRTAERWYGQRDPS
jgi:hypothetical protein